MGHAGKGRSCRQIVKLLSSVKTGVIIIIAPPDREKSRLIKSIEAKGRRVKTISPLRLSELAEFSIRWPSCFDLPSSLCHTDIDILCIENFDLLYGTGMHKEEALLQVTLEAIDEVANDRLVILTISESYPALLGSKHYPTILYKQ